MRVIEMAPFVMIESDPFDQQRKVIVDFVETRHDDVRILSFVHRKNDEVSWCYSPI